MIWLTWIIATRKLCILECEDDILIVFLCSEVLKACMSESGMQFDDGEVRNLAKALFDDAVKVSRFTLSLSLVRGTFSHVRPSNSSPAALNVFQ